MIRNQSRREFLKVGLATGAVFAAGGSAGLFGARESFAGDVPDLVIVRGASAAAMTRAAVDGLGGIKRFVKPGSKVVIKPNMSFARRPGEAANTNPEVVAEVARMCSEAGASRISVLDNVLHAAQDCLSMSKIPATCEVIPKTVVANVQAHRMFKETKAPNGVLFKRMEVLADVLEADVLIAVPVGKTHGSAGVSLSMKGMMGLIYDRHSFHGRYNLQEAIVDMVTVLKPHLVVIDGTRILSTGGPSGPGKVIPLNLVIASTDMVAADAQMVALGTWYGKKIDPGQVKHIKLAAQRGLGRMDLENLKIRNTTI